MKPPTSLPLAFAAVASFGLVGLAACGDNDESIPTDSASIDAGTDAPDLDAPPPIDAPIDAPAFVVPTPFAVPLAAAGPDQLQSAVAGPGGTFYAAGYAAQTVAGPRFVTVVQMSTTGPVLAFGTGGVATTALDFRGGSGEVGLGVQSTGKLIVSATVASATVAGDRDIAIARLNADGTLDTSFGDQGVRIVDLSTAFDNNGTLTGMDSARGVVVGAADVIYVYGVSRGDGNNMAGNPRLDTDFTVAKLDADGTRDLSFGGGDGKYTLDLQESNATARGINLLADGTLLASGYANSPGLGTVQPVMIKLSTDGVPVTAFASGGIFHDTVLALQTEVYNVAVHGADLVTAGYGRDTGTQNDWVSLRFDATTGARDLTWGGAANGAVVIDVSAAMIGDNCRSAVALPGGKTALIGSTGPGNMPAQDAAFAILDASGALDTAYGDGVHTFALGANGNDQFWGGAVSGTNLLIVGYQGGGSAQTELMNDDSYGIIVPLQ
jgi:uncharacterized delta-60 repeat protein